MLIFPTWLLVIVYVILIILGAVAIYKIYKRPKTEKNMRTSNHVGTRSSVILSIIGFVLLSIIALIMILLNNNLFANESWTVTSDTFVIYTIFWVVHLIVDFIAYVAWQMLFAIDNMLFSLYYFDTSFVTIWTDEFFIYGYHGMAAGYGEFVYGAGGNTSNTAIALFGTIFSISFNVLWNVLFVIVLVALLLMYIGVILSLYAERTRTRVSLASLTALNIISFRWISAFLILISLDPLPKEADNEVIESKPDYSKLTKNDMMKLLSQKDIKYKKSSSKSELLEILEGAK